ncbi:MAG: rhodanese-like domain-containing protein [Flavobacteriales bacterium]|nr:rhodanese-like domain-containing protein [Flavobacteriales bacterium]
MISFFKNLFNRKKMTQEMIKQGAIVIDVRSREEFRAGHAKGAVNIPLQELSGKIKSYGKNDALVLCCASGMRSASAVAALKAQGYTNVHNAGSWMNI